MKKDFGMILFWFCLVAVCIAYAKIVYGEFTQEEVVYDKDIIAEILPIDITDCTTQECYRNHPDYTYDPYLEKTPLPTKEEIVADVKHEELKGPKYTIRVGLGGARKPIPPLWSETTDDRAFEFLGEYGLQFTKDTWRAYGDKYGIDYTLPICIAWADSHLGNALKSKNNLGNIGNNDRGDVKHFETLDAGIEAIFWSLAKGKYMSGHTTIGTLSGEGRKRLGLPGCNEEKDYRKKCYATSMGVWSTNVTNCMSILHDKQIDENYEFRR